MSLPQAPPDTWSGGISFEEAQRASRVIRPAHQPLVNVLVDGATLRPGLRVLDLACGQATPALDEAAVVSTGGRVVGLDISLPAVRLARQFAAAASAANTAFLRGDGERLPFPDASFDRLTSRFGPMFFPHLDRALGEARRVLRPRGLIAWLVWDSIETQPFFSATALVAFRHSGLRELPAEANQPFRFGVGDELPRAMRSAGFERVRAERRTVPYIWATTPEALAGQFYDAPPPPFRAIVARLGPDALAAARAESVERFRGVTTDGEVRLDASVILVRGERPG